MSSFLLPPSSSSSTTLPSLLLAQSHFLAPPPLSSVPSAQPQSAAAVSENTSERVRLLEEEVQRLREGLKRAKGINEEMWKGVVDVGLGAAAVEEVAEGRKRVRGGK